LGELTPNTLDAICGLRKSTLLFGGRLNVPLMIEYLAKKNGVILTPFLQLKEY
jgi:hypothetical protein